MDMWHFLAAIEGYAKAHFGIKEASDEVSDDTLRALGIEGFT